MTANTGDKKLLTTVMKTVADKIASDLPQVVRCNYNELFMNAIFQSVLGITQDDHLRSLLCVPSL